MRELEHSDQADLRLVEPLWYKKKLEDLRDGHVESQGLLVEDCSRLVWKGKDLGYRNIYRRSEH